MLKFTKAQFTKMELFSLQSAVSNSHLQPNEYRLQLLDKIDAMIGEHAANEAFK